MSQTENTPPTGLKSPRKMRGLALIEAAMVMITLTMVILGTMLLFTEAKDSAQEKRIAEEELRMQQEAFRKDHIARLNAIAASQSSQIGNPAYNEKEIFTTTGPIKESETTFVDSFTAQAESLADTVVGEAVQMEPQSLTAPSVLPLSELQSAPVKSGEPQLLPVY